MHRLTARLLLIALLAGSYAPVALAFSSTPPHACCLRKQSPSSSESSFDSRHYGEDCCRLMAASQWAQPRSAVMAYRSLTQQSVDASVCPDHPTVDFRNLLSVRAPPASEIA
jgi:hypothetical protein